MKLTRLFTAVLAALCLAVFTLAGLAPAEAGGAKIKFDKTVYDFGTLKQGGSGRASLKFKNTGSAPLIISNVKSSCGCLVPRAPQEPIMPGQSGVISFKYDTKRVVGAFNKMMTVMSNAQPPRVALKVKGVVKARPTAPY